MNITALLVSTKLEAPITEALPKATLGLRLTLLSAYLHYALGMTTRNICAWLRTFCQFQVTPGGLVLNWQQLAELLSPVYDHLAKAAKLSAVLNLRSAAERTNSTLKDDNAILREPPVRSLRRGFRSLPYGRYHHPAGSCHQICCRRDHRPRDCL